MLQFWAPQNFSLTIKTALYDENLKFLFLPNWLLLTFVASQLPPPSGPCRVNTKTIFAVWKILASELAASCGSDLFVDLTTTTTVAAAMFSFSLSLSLYQVPDRSIDVTSYIISSPFSIRITYYSILILLSLPLSHTLTLTHSLSFPTQLLDLFFFLVVSSVKHKLRAVWPDG